MKINELLAIAEFLGSDMSEEQAVRLMDEARDLSVRDKYRLLRELPGGAFYTEAAMHDGEMGGLSRY